MTTTAPTPTIPSLAETVSFEFPFTFYEAGPMSGYEHWNFPAFHAAAAHVRALHTNVLIISPAEEDEALGFDPYAVKPGEFSRQDWHDAMRRDVEILLTVDGIFLLPGWEKSEGANIELTVGRAIGLQIFLYDVDHGLIWWPAA